MHKFSLFTWPNRLCLHFFLLLIFFLTEIYRSLLYGREIVIIKEKECGKLKNHYVCGTFSSILFSLYYSYNLFEAIFQSHATCGQLKKSYIHTYVYLYIYTSPHPIPVAINHGNCQGVPPLYIWMPSPWPLINRQGTHIPSTIHILSFFIRYAAQSSARNGILTCHMRQLGFH